MSALSEEEPVGREDPRHYAPRWLREKPEQRFSVIEELRPQERRPDNLPRSMSAPSPLDAQLEGADTSRLAFVAGQEDKTNQQDGEATHGSGFPA